MFEISITKMGLKKIGYCITIYYLYALLKAQHFNLFAVVTFLSTKYI